MHDKRKRNSGRSTFFIRVFEDFCNSSTHYSSKLASLKKSCDNIICDSMRASELGLGLKYSYSWDPTKGGALVVEALDPSLLIKGLQVVGGVTASKLDSFVKNFSNAGVASKKINNQYGMIISDIVEKKFFRCHPLLYIPMRDIPRKNFVTKIFAYLSEILFYDLPTNIITPVPGRVCYDIDSCLQFTYSWSMEMGGKLIIKSRGNKLDSLLNGLHMVAGIKSLIIESILKNIRKIGYTASCSSDHYVLTISDTLPGNLESFRCHPSICGKPRLSCKRVKCSVVETQSTGGSDVDCLMRGLVPPMQVPSVSPVHGLLGGSPAQTLMRPEASSAAHKPLSNNGGESSRSDDTIPLPSHDKGETGASDGVSDTAMSKNIAQKIFVDFMRNAGITSQADIETNQNNYAETKSISGDVQYTYT